MNTSLGNPELHAIGVYHGKRDNKPVSTTPPNSTNQLEMNTAYNGTGRAAAHNPIVNKTSQNNKFGEITVNISIVNRPLILAFSAYEKTIWNVKLKKNVRMEKVILSGYHQQKISGIPEDTPIEVYTYESSPCERCYQGQGYFYSYKSPPINELKKISGLNVSSWQGRYSGDEFSIFPNIPRYSK